MEITGDLQPFITQGFVLFLRWTKTTEIVRAFAKINTVNITSTIDINSDAFFG